MATALTAKSGCRNCHLKSSNRPKSPMQQAKDKQKRLQALKPVLDTSKI